MQTIALVHFYLNKINNRHEVLVLTADICASHRWHRCTHNPLHFIICWTRTFTAVHTLQGFSQSEFGALFMSIIWLGCSAWGADKKNDLGLMCIPIRVRFIRVGSAVSCITTTKTASAQRFRLKIRHFFQDWQWSCWQLQQLWSHLSCYWLSRV